MCADDRVAVYLLVPDWSVVLVKAALPCGSGIFANRMVESLIAEKLFRRIAVLVSLPIMVAVDEKPLYVASVRCLVVGKHRLPCTRNSVELIHEPVVGNVSADYDAVNALVPEPFQGSAKHLLAMKHGRTILDVHAYMDVRDYTESHVRLAGRKYARRGT